MSKRMDTITTYLGQLRRSRLAGRVAWLAFLVLPLVVAACTTNTSGPPGGGY